GLLVARGLSEESEILVWVRAVATAILAGVIAQLIATSSGALATVPLAVRIAAVAAGFLAFVTLRRSVLAGVAGGGGAGVVGAGGCRGGRGGADRRRHDHGAVITPGSAPP